MDKRTFKDNIYHHLAQMVKAMGNPHRLEILELLAQGSYSVEEIAAETDLSVANASQHLQVMKRARLVVSRKEGVTAYYHLADEKIYRAWKALRDLGMENIADIERIMRDFRQANDSVEALTSSELYEKMQNEEVRIIDVRPETEYSHGHIANAESVPLDRLEERLQDLPADQEIVVYCRGPFCVFADQAVSLLRDRGFSGKRLQEGYPEWALEGFPVDSNQ